MVSPFTFIIVDDEPPALSVIKSLMQSHPQFQMLAAFTDPEEALASIRDARPDLLLLDVEMPKMTGLAMLERVREEEISPPVTAFITGKAEYAIEAFRLGVRDYVLKPVAPDRLALTLENLTPLLEAARSEAELPAVLSFKDGTGHRLISPQDIFWIEAGGNFSELVMEDGSRTLVSESLRELAQRLAGFGFVRIHKSIIVNRIQVRETSPSRVILSNGEVCAVGRTFRESLLSFIDPK
ncbi:LytTR family DNA-binding domain-containing protein [uncultured Erythrobacter sp.]|uniref:LytR/AlgR family response regulator transcription factor n=1 Tax=uncultured Erythrobacter sp. TaxID=263913 RepID=UPI00263A1D0C|nr:LytTR family DNA-binding domain-containing protein [uncultured Erythrobacter sp.]